MHASISSHVQPLVVAVTGGVASGKSALTDRLAALGAKVLDADEAARVLVIPGAPALSEIVQRFGAGILNDDGSLNRRALRDIIFADDEARLDLEAILHPAIRHYLKQQACEPTSAPYVVVGVPLLAEVGVYDWLNRVVVVDVPVAVQLQRLMNRDGMTEAKAQAMIDAQASRSERLAIADDVVKNDGSLADLDAHATKLHAHLAWMASTTKKGPPTSGGQNSGVQGST